MQIKRRQIALIAVYLLAVLVGGLILFNFAPEQYGFYPRCTLFALTGLQCPGCGGLRATHHLLHGDLQSAWRLNPLLFVLLPLMALFFAAHIANMFTGRSFSHVFLRPVLLWTLAGGCLLFGFLRNLL